MFHLSVVLALLTLAAEPSLPCVSVWRPTLCILDSDCGQRSRCFVEGIGFCSFSSTTKERSPQTPRDLANTAADTGDVTTNVTAGVTADSADGASSRQLFRLSLPAFFPCLSDQQCGSGQCWELGVGVCVPDRRCADCRPHQWCDGSRCRAKKELAAPCGVSAECRSSICGSDNTCGCKAGDCTDTQFCSPDATCEPKKKEYDESCASPDECISSNCRLDNLCGCQVDDCTESTFCSEKGTCEPKKGYNQGCSIHDECFSSNCRLDNLCGCQIGDCTNIQYCSQEGTCKGYTKKGYHGILNTR